MQCNSGWKRMYKKWIVVNAHTGFHSFILIHLFNPENMGSILILSSLQHSSAIDTTQSKHILPINTFTLPFASGYNLSWTHKAIIFSNNIVEVFQCLKRKGGTQNNKEKQILTDKINIRHSSCKPCGFCQVLNIERALNTTHNSICHPVCAASQS